MSDDREDDPFLDWSRIFHGRDVVRLPDGGVAVVVSVNDCSEDSDPPKWEMYLDFRGRRGAPDAGWFRCRDCTPAPDAQSRAEAERLELFRSA